MKNSNHSIRLIQLTSLAGLCSVLAAGCGSSFNSRGKEDCESTRSCTAAGGGAGGVGGTVVPDCVKDADCTDKDPCNGIETCSGAGTCVAGEVACPASADAHCSVTCSNDAGTAKCTTAAKDVDGDAHGDAKCAAAPGDDCDDTNKAAFPGAAEICDGVDQNCNGVKDIAEVSVPLSSAVKAIARSGRGRGWPLAIAPDQDGGFALANVTLGKALEFEHRSALFEDPDKKIAVGSTSDASSRVALAYGNKTVGHKVLWKESGINNGSFVSEVSVGASAVVGATFTVLESTGGWLSDWSAAWNPTRGEWGASLWEGTGFGPSTPDRKGILVEALGSPAGARSLITSTPGYTRYSPKIVTGAGLYALVATRIDYPGDTLLVVYAGNLVANLAPKDEFSKAPVADINDYTYLTGFFPVMLGEKDVITFVWREGVDNAGAAGAELVLRRMGPDTKWIGSPVRIKNPDFLPTALVRTSQGLALIGQSEEAYAKSVCQPQLLLLADDGSAAGPVRNLGDGHFCDAGEVLAVNSEVTTDGVTAPGNTVVAWSSGGIGYYRLLGKNLCD